MSYDSPELRPCAYDPSHPPRLVPVAELRRSKHGKFYCNANCRRLALRKRPGCGRPGCEKMVKKIGDQYCSAKCEKLDNPIIEECSLEGCDVKFHVDQSTYRQSRNKRFFCCDYHRLEDIENKKPTCLLEGCSNKAEYRRLYCSDEHQQLDKAQKQPSKRFALPCSTPGCDGERWYYPSTVTKGRVICGKCLKAGVGSKPKTGEIRTCALEGCPATFYASPSSTRRFCTPAHVNKAKSVPKIKRICEYDEVEFWVYPSDLEYNACRFHTKECEQLSRIKRGTGEWFNGREVILDQSGYELLWMPDHPGSFHGRYPRHIFVKELEKGAFIEEGNDVHHRDENKRNNHESNLEEKDHDEHLAHSARSFWARMKKMKEEWEIFVEKYGPISDSE